MNLARSKTDVTETEQSTIDLLQAVLMMNIAANRVGSILNSDLPLPDGMNANVLQKTIETMGRFTRETKRTIGKTNSYLDRLPGEEFILNATTISTLLFRIGIEQGHEMYEEFFGMLIDLVDVVFYAQSHRRALNFPKYRKLVKLITDEVRADVNRTPNQVQYFQGELFFKSVPPVHDHKIE